MRELPRAAWQLKLIPGGHGRTSLYGYVKRTTQSRQPARCSGSNGNCADATQKDGSMYNNFRPLVARRFRP